MLARTKDHRYRHTIEKYNAIHGDADEVDDAVKPLINGCKDNWTWNKRHRSHEVDLPEPSLRKGIDKVHFNCFEYFRC